ncbi:hypothetical protein Tco_0071074 [Tanacetum coccineum]
MNQTHFEHNSNYFGFDQPPQYSIDHQEDLNQQRISDVYDRWDKLEESHNELLNMLQSFCEMVIQQKQAANLCTHTPKPSRHFNSFYDDDDYKESTIPLNEIVSPIPPSIAITSVLLTLELEDSLSIGDENLSTIPEKESDEFIKSSVENLVPIPSESEDTSGNDSKCDLPSCDDFSPINIYEEKSVTFSNPLFDSNDDFTSSDDESLSDEDVPLIENKLIQQKQAANIDQSPPQEMSIQDIEDLKQHYLDEMKSISNQIQIKDYRNERINIRFRRECEIMIDELKGKFNGMSIEINKKKELQQLEQAANLSTYTTKPSRRFNFYDDDDYEESTIPLNEIVSQIPSSIAITPVLPTMEPEDSLIMGDEELSTIPEKKSDEFIKSSVEDLVPIPSESEDTSGSDSEYDLSSCNDFSPINVSEEKSVTFSNPLFNSNDDFTSSDDESLSDEDVPKDNTPMFLNKPDLLVTPLFKLNEDECFDPGGDVDEIELLLHRDPSTPKINIASILEGFIDEPPHEENDDLFNLEYKENE